MIQIRIEFHCFLTVSVSVIVTMHHVRHDAAEKNEMTLQPEVVRKSNPNPNFNVKHSILYGIFHLFPLKRLTLYHMALPVFTFL